MRNRRLARHSHSTRDIHSDLAQRCEQRLFAAARCAGAASRQQLRAAARRFVKRHRGDRSYLEWVLRRVAASAASALALLGLDPAHAALNGGPVFDPFASNPLAGAPSVLRAAPALADLDADGDLDLLAGEESGAFRYFRNTGTATAPAYLELTGTANPANGLSVSSNFSQPALGDLDGDGDLDLVAGEEPSGSFTSYENTGSATAPAFVLRSGSDNPLDGLGVGSGSGPVFADLNADAAPDLVSGDLGGNFHTFYLPEPSRGLALGAGLGLLRWLRSLRARRRGRALTPVSCCVRGDFHAVERSREPTSA
jgi:hypothetical protein